jgi:peptidoglycan/xylan/chitin deacetylase (PgdA/CDA1 family)
MSERDAPRFLRTLSALRNAYEFVSLPQAVELLRERSPGGRYVCFSFDDAYRAKHDLIAPLLEQYGARGCFFIATNLIGMPESDRRRILRDVAPSYADEEVMTWDMVRQLSRSGHTIGCHTLDHVDLGRVDQQTAIHQVLESQRVIERQLGIPCRVFAWPKGLVQHFPPTLLPRVAPSFDAVFSAIRSRFSFSYDGGVINRDHFEPGWPTSHVRYFLARRVSPISA